MLDSGTVELKFKKESVNKIIDECISRTEVLADIRDVRIEKTVKNDFSLDCDFRWICEAVSNIVKNCIEHTDGGYVKISAEQYVFGNHHKRQRLRNQPEGFAPHF